MEQDDGADDQEGTEDFKKFETGKKKQKSRP
jgi:hypothetical protein